MFHNVSVINAAILNGKEEIFASEATIRVYKEKTFDFKQHALTPVKGAKFAHFCCNSYFLSVGTL